MAQPGRPAAIETPVVFESHGQQIVGIVHRPAGTSGRVPAVVLCHGFTGQKVEPHRLFVKMGRALASTGLGALRFDFRGSGDSAGEFEEMTLGGEVEDALGALAFTRRHLGEPVGLLGLSLGGAVAALTAGRDAGVAALVLWAAVGHPGRIARGFGERPGGVRTYHGRFDLDGNLVGQAFLDDLFRHDPLEAVRGYRGPALVVHGSGDTVVPPSDAGDYMAALAGQDRTYLPVAGADHTFNRADWEATVVNATAAWLAERLRG